MTAVRRNLKGHGLLWLGVGLLVAALALTFATVLYANRGGSSGIGSGNNGGFPGGVPAANVEEGNIDGARRAAEQAVNGYGNPDLQVAEVMEFANNYYAQVKERDTDRFAVELLINKRTGEVSPEQGPNMMWNTKYGMMGGSGMMDQSGMMGDSYQANPDGRMPVDPEQAKQVANDYLDRVSPGAKAVEPDAFYGYYTLHTERDGEITGMLSVNGYSGEVWYHNWHGSFVAMEEG